MRLVERPVGLDADDAVHPQATALLERANGTVDGVIEQVTVRIGQQVEAAELGADLGYDGTRVTAPQDLHRSMLAALPLPQTGRRGNGDPEDHDQTMHSRSRSNAALGLAPTMLLTTSPPWKTDIVGIDMIW